VNTTTQEQLIPVGMNKHSRILIDIHVSYQIRLIAHGICKGTAVFPTLYVTVTGFGVIYVRQE
jgi:hypothetical protein